jgi:hypothetical protein
VNRDYVAQIRPGDFVDVLTADGKTLRKRALSGMVPGRDFVVVWVVSPEKYDVKDTSGVPTLPWGQRVGARVRAYPPGCPWPEEDVALARLDSEAAEEDA